MKTIINISDAAIIALHALDLMAKNKNKLLSTARLAKHLDVSYNHLSKIMQQLTKAGLVSPVRGPKGGFTLNKKAGKIRLKNIIEVMDGGMNFSNCLMKKKVCARKKCAISEFLSDTNDRLKKVIDIKLDDFAETK